MARLPLRLAMSGAALVAAAAAWTCLPDLATTCGNGHIDANETCDPGVMTNPGCSEYCQVVCPEGVQGTTAYAEDPSSNHCYFTTAAGNAQTFDAGGATCRTATAHVVTLVDDEETAFVVENLTGGWKGASSFWLGDYRTSDDGPYRSVASSPNFEPGWDVVPNCYGCFMHGDTNGSPLPAFDAGAEGGEGGAGPRTNIVDTSLGSDDGTTVTVGGAATANVVCEREPVGSRSVPCGAADAGLTGSFCFQTVALGGTKSYLYSPTPVSAESAESRCQSLGGGASLVVFTSRKEREQVIYELTQLHLLKNGLDSLPPTFWIGLSYEKASKEWKWDDGVPSDSSTAATRPLVWGAGQSETTDISNGAYAYVNLTSAYDTGLAYNEGHGPYPFVCQY